MKNTRGDPADVVNALYAQARQKYPDMQWNVIKQTENDVLYEWVLSNGYQNWPPQAEIARVIWTKKGTHRVTYKKKTSQLDAQTRELWLNRIGSAKFIY